VGRVDNAQALRAFYSKRFNIDDFKQWTSNKYAKNYQVTIIAYVRKYSHILFSDNVRELDNLPASIRNNVIKSLTILSKYLAIYDQWHEKLNKSGIKLNGVSNYNAFLRIMTNSNNSNNNVLQWVNNIKPILRDNENLFIQFLRTTGVRKEEAITSFNLIIELSKANRLSEYYDFNFNCLQHFKYPRLFIRRTKNLYISFIPQNLIDQISNSKPITYSSIRKRLRDKGFNVRFDQLRDNFATMLIQNGFNELEVNLLQGRINGILFKHYWSPKISEIRDRVFEVLVS
jgi:intergrase/recombinase